MYRISLINNGDILVNKTFFRKKENVCIKEKDRISIYSSINPNINIAKYISTLKKYKD